MSLPKFQWDKKYTPILLIAGIAIIWRIAFLLTGVSLTDSDESVEAIMAQRILNGEHYIYFVDQHYMGRIECYALAAFFGITQLQNPLGIKIFMILETLLYITSLFYLCSLLFKNRHTALYAILFAAASPATFTYWSLKPRAFMTIAIIGQIILIVALQLNEMKLDEKRFYHRWCLLFFLFGLSLYQYILIAPYLILTALIIVIGPHRNWILEQFKKWYDLMIFIPMAGILLILTYQGLGVFGLPLNQGTYQFFALVILALSTILGFLKILQTQRVIQFKFQLSILLTCFALGNSPAIYHSATATDLWYKSQPVTFSDTLLNMVTSSFSNLPLLLGTMQSPSAIPSDLLKDHVYMGPVLTFFYIIFQISILFIFVYITIRVNVPGIDSKVRKSNLLIILFLGMAYAIFCKSGAGMYNTRHLLPLYTGIFLILGFVASFLYQNNKWAGIGFAIILITCFGWFNFRHNYELPNWPGYYRQSVYQMIKFMEENKLEAAYVHDAGVAHEVQFGLGAKYSIVPAFQMLRFKDAQAKLEQSDSYVYFSTQELQFEESIQYKSKKIANYFAYYQFMINDQPIPYNQFKRYINK